MKRSWQNTACIVRTCPGMQVAMLGPHFLCSTAIVRASLSAHPSGQPCGKAERPFRNYYVSRMLDPLSGQMRASRGIGAAVKGLIQATWWSPRTVVRRLFWARVRKVLPPAVVKADRAAARPPRVVPARLGPLRRSRRLAPISRTFGFDRGTPVDRYYIERFLAENAGDIRGQVLEIGDNVYTQRFGAGLGRSRAMFFTLATNPRATLIGDLARLDVLPAAAFDCIVLTQTLHFVFDMRAAVATLAPGAQARRSPSHDNAWDEPRRPG